MVGLALVLLLGLHLFRRVPLVAGVVTQAQLYAMIFFTCLAMDNLTISISHNILFTKLSYTGHFDSQKPTEQGRL